MPRLGITCTGHAWLRSVPIADGRLIRSTFDRRGGGGGEDAVASAGNYVTGSNMAELPELEHLMIDHDGILEKGVITW